MRMRHTVSVLFLWTSFVKEARLVSQLQEEQVTLQFKKSTVTFVEPKMICDRACKNRLCGPTKFNNFSNVYLAITFYSIIVWLCNFSTFVYNTIYLVLCPHARFSQDWSHYTSNLLYNCSFDSNRTASHNLRTCWLDYIKSYMLGAC